jgi:hypothetical protein
LDTFFGLSCLNLDVTVLLDSSWVRVFVDVAIANDAMVFLQDRFSVLWAVGSSHYGVVFFAIDAGHNRVVGIIGDSLNDVVALFVQKVIRGLDVVHRQSSLSIC